MDYWSRLIALVAVLLCISVQTIHCHGHEEHHNVTMDIDKPIKSLVPLNMTDSVMSKTIFQIIQDYINETTVDSVTKSTKYNMSKAVIVALNNTAIQVMVSCYGDAVSIESSVAHVLETVMRRFNLTMEFKRERLEMLNKTGLMSIFENNTDTNTLSFCSNLLMTLKDNFENLLNNESMTRIKNNNGTVYQMAFQRLGVSNNQLMKFLIAKYMNNENEIKELSMMIHAAVLNTLAGKMNLTSNKNLKNLINEEFSLPANFFEVEIKEMFKLPQFVVLGLGQTHINNLPGYMNETTTIKDLLEAAQQVESKLEHIFNTPLAVAARALGFQFNTIADITKLKFQQITDTALGFKNNPPLSFITVEYIYDKFSARRPMQGPLGFVPAILLPKLAFSAMEDFKMLPPFQSISVTLTDILNSYDLNSQAVLLITKPGKLAQYANISYEKHLPQVFDTIPLSLFTTEFLAEDLNVDPFDSIIMKLFKDEDLFEKIHIEQIVHYYLSTFSMKFMNHEFPGSLTLGMFRQNILMTKEAFASLVVNGNLQQTFQLCARKGQNLNTTKIMDFFKACLGIEYNNGFIQARISKVESDSNMNNASLGIFIKTSNMTMLQLMSKLLSTGIDLNSIRTSVREVLILSSTDDAYLLAKPISSFVNFTTNHTLPEILTEARKQAGIINYENMDQRVLSAWANTNETKNLISHPVSQLLSTMLPVQIAQLSIGDVINFIQFPYKKPFVSMCGGNAMNMKPSLEILTSCMPNKSMFRPLGYTRLKAFTVEEVGLLSAGMANSTMNILNILDLVNKGFEKVMIQTSESLVLLARNKNISLSDLKSQTLEITLTQILGVDKNVIRKVFSDINNATYKMVSETSLMGLVNEDSGLKSVQELYTGSVQTMAATILEGQTSVEAIEKHLPRYVTLISSMDFNKLFFVYETSSENLKDMSLVDVVHLFFGNFTAETFKNVYSLDDQHFTKLNKMTFKTAQTLVHDATKKSTLLGLIKAAAVVDDTRIGFLTAKLKDLYAGGMDNTTIESLANFNQSFNTVFKKLVRQSYKQELKDAIVNKFFEMNLTSLKKLVNKNMSDIENITITDLFTMTLDKINECSYSNGFCPRNGLCNKRMGITEFSCECKDGFSGNGTKCEDECVNKNCSKRGVCINNVNGPTCRCADNFIFRNETCKSAKRIVKLKGMRFVEDYDPAFANKTSKKFLQLVERIEPVLLKVLQKNNSAVTAVSVTNVTSGSIVVDAEVFIEDEKSSPESVSNIIEEAAQKNELDGLTPAANFSASFSELEDPCDQNTCGEHSVCMKEDAATYSCKCESGYTMNGGNCRKEEEEDDDDNLALKVALPVCLIGGLFIVILIFCCCCRNKDKNYGEVSGTELRGKPNNAYET